MAKKGAPKRNLFNLTLRGMEELDNFKTPEERQRALEEVGSDVRLRDLAMGITMCAGAGFAGFWVVRLVFEYILPKSIPAWVAENSCYVGGAVSMFMMMRFLHRWGTARELRKKLVGTGVPVCVGCGYKLVGLPSRTETCPECGRSLESEVVRLLQADEDSTVAAGRADASQPGGTGVVP